MVFNSLDFLIFIIVFFSLYWFAFNKNLKAQNVWLLAGSYVFYCWWDWHFLWLLIGSSLLNYVLGIYMYKTESDKRKQLLLYIGLLWGLGLLLYFKYFNFFITSLSGAFSKLGITLELSTLQIIIPLGISFYTFRTISYLLDIKKGKIEPVRDWVVFFSYVAFFPSVVSGPIDRVNTLVPQLERNRIFGYNQAADGMRQVLWGLFKKVVIADNCALITNQVFENYHSLSSATLLLGAFYFTIQLYADFSGYSDMAIGIAKLLGFTITKNFNYPFFAQNISEYWRNWHMSLTSWLTEYVFTPLSIAFRDYGKKGLILSILINFIVIGIWHGANWTFVLFGFLHGCYYIPLIIKGTFNKKKKIVANKLLPSAVEFKNMILTFILVMLTNIIFKAESISHAFQYWKRLFSFSLSNSSFAITSSYSLPVFIAILLGVEWLQKDKVHGLQIENIKRPTWRHSVYYCIILTIILFGATNANQFIYFQF